MPYIPRTRTGEVKLMPSQIIAGKIIAKATIKRPDGSVFILAAFNLGNYHEFFFKFSAPSPRSPRKKWKLLGWFGVYKGAYMSFDQAVAFAASQLNDSAALTIKKRYPIGKRALNQIVENISHPVAQPLPAGASIERVNLKMKNGREGRAASFFRRG